MTTGLPFFTPFDLRMPERENIRDQSLSYVYDFLWSARAGFSGFRQAFLAMFSTTDGYIFMISSVIFKVSEIKHFNYNIFFLFFGKTHVFFT